MITQSELKEVLSYDEMTGQFVWIKSTSDRIKVGDEAGAIRPDGYRSIQVNGKRTMAHRWAWLYVFGNFPDCEIDHINGNRSDNRLVNLRLATSKQNKENTRLKINNTSGHRGVSWDASREKWLAHVVHNRKFHNIGRFDDIDDAVKAVKEARNQLFTHHLTCYSA